MSSRRRRGGLAPIIAAGLIKFDEARELERIKLNPKIVVIMGFLFPVIVLLLRLLFSP